MKQKNKLASAVLVLIALVTGTIQIQALEIPEVIPLETWQAKYKYWKASNAPDLKKADPKNQYRANGDIKFLTFHHVGSSAEGKRQDQEITAIGNRVWMWHARDNTFQEVAYHYIVGDSGRIYKGRPDDIAPASGEYYFPEGDLASATYKENGAIALEKPKDAKIPGYNQGHLTICFLVGNQRPSPQALESAAKLAAFLIKKRNLKTNAMRVHRETANSTCPGDEIHSWLRGSLTPNAHKQEGEGIKRIKELIEEG